MASPLFKILINKVWFKLNRDHSANASAQVGGEGELGVCRPVAPCRESNNAKPFPFPSQLLLPLCQVALHLFDQLLLLNIRQLNSAAL